MSDGQGAIPAADKEAWIRVYEWFHAHPETGLKEKETTEKIRDILNGQGIKILETGLKTGLLAVIEGGKEGSAIGIRADIDALPVEEETGLSYCSTRKGFMHACGHDYHITSLLMAASRLQEEREGLRGKIYLIFQPAEEIFVGADLMLMETRSYLKEVKAFYGFHAEPSLRPGVIGITEGAVTASVDRFRVDVKGVGTHAALPHLGKSPIDVMTALIQTVTSLPLRSVSTFQPAVISIAQIHAGDSWNIIPERGFFEGTVRAFDEKVRERIHSEIARVVEEYGTLTETDCTLKWTAGHGSVISDRELCEECEAVANELAERTRSESYPEGRITPNRLPPTMTGDDFGHYRESIPGSKAIYLRIGVGVTHSLHHPQFQVDPEAIPLTAEYLVNMMTHHLKEEENTYV